MADADGRQSAKPSLRLNQEPVSYTHLFCTLSSHQNTVVLLSLLDRNRQGGWDGYVGWLRLCVLKKQIIIIIHTTKLPYSIR